MSSRRSASSQSGLSVDRTGQVRYVVGSHDTLSGIAQRHLGRASRWQQIFELNRDRLTSADNLKIGTVLRLPVDASHPVQAVREPRNFR
ncbi:MAG: LysM peptidoglycan-binding domain-containing protein [Planctomycetes bacterium]|nr:LysM peptidoglycan-binding domain-containing protein [Planctomycetota bacterium]